MRCIHHIFIQSHISPFVLTELQQKIFNKVSNWQITAMQKAPD